MKIISRSFHIVGLAVCLAIGCLQTAYAWSGDTWGTITRDQIHNIANAAINVAWSPNRSFDNYCCSSEGWIRYNAGTTYYGEAYSMSNPVENLDEFINAVHSIPSTGADKYLGNDCSGFVSVSWKLPARYTTTTFGNDANGSQNYCFSLGGTGTNSSVGLQLGDACVDPGSHIIMVESISSSGGVNSMEETPLHATKRYWSWSSLSGYQPIRRKSIVAPVYTDNPPYLFDNDTEGWTEGNHMSKTWWTDCCDWPGVLVADQNGDDAWIYSPETNFTPPQYPQVINVNLYPQSGTTASHNMKLYWKTATEGFDETKSSPDVDYTAQNDWTAVNLSVNNAKWWNDTIKQLRLDFDGTNTATRFIINHIVLQNQVWYDFNEDTMGWTAGHSLTTPWWTNCCGWPGVLVADQNGSDAYLFGPDISGSGFPFNYLGGVNDKIHVRVYPQSGTTASHSMAVYWISSTEGSFDESKSVRVDFTGQNEWVDVYLPVGQNPKWGMAKHIKRLRLDFDSDNTQTRWIVNYIRTEY